MAKCKNCKHLKIDSSIEKKICFLIGEIGNPDEEISCACYRPATNADRIRSMMDEELAEFLEKTVRDMGDNMFKCENQTLEKCMDCKECYLAWLKSEVGCE